MKKPICLITGVGDGTGSASARRFAQGDYQVAMLARDLGPKGIHVAYITIDAAIDTPWTRDVFNRDKPDNFFSKPVDIADEVFHVAHQPRSTWSFDVEIRPYIEKW